MVTISNDLRLWVPMQVQAFAYSGTGAVEFLDLTPTYAKLDDQQEAALSEKLKPRLETTQDPDFLSPGIHLHWMLPEAFTHVRPSADGRGADLPSAPNRWLVTRIWDDGGKIGTRSWVVESDALGDPANDSDAGMTAAPWLEETEKAVTVTQIGRTFDLAGWKEQDRSRRPTATLTAFAPGNMAFAAFYPSCRGVFGLHDAAEDLASGTACTYLVAGWFSDRTRDPLYPATAMDQDPDSQLEKLMAKLAEHQWALPTGTSHLPTAVTCYGITSAAKWAVDTQQPAEQPPAVRVALGHTMIEAIAALAREKSAATDRLVSQMQLAALSAARPTREDVQSTDFFKTLGRMLGAQAKLHARRFSARGGGSCWDIVVSEKKGEKDGASQQLPKLTNEMAVWLKTLNGCQRQLDEAKRAVESARGALFTAWYLERHWSTDAVNPADDAQKAELVKRVRARAQDVQTADADCTASAQRLDTARTAVTGLLASNSPGGTPTLDLVERARPRFWQANDPFVLIDGLQGPVMQGGASPLICRVSDQTVSRLELTDVPDFGQVTVDRKTLRTLVQASFNDDSNIPSDIAELVLDTVFTDHHRSGLLATGFLASSGRPNPSTEQIKGLTKSIDAAQKRIETAAALLAGDTGALGPDLFGLPLKGIDPEALRSLLSAITAPSTSARPVYMVWGGTWTSHGQFGQSWPTDVWSLGDAIDFQTTQIVPPSSKDGEHLIEGHGIIAMGLERGLTSSAKASPIDYQPYFAKLARLSGQGLFGLTDVLARRAPGPHLGPLARDAETGDLLPDRAMARLVDQHYGEAPLLSPENAPAFSPLRAGAFDLARLWIVDSFGRVQKIIDAGTPRPIISQTMALSTQDKRALLAPRLVQPARLDFRWLSAKDDGQESLGDSDTSPICGFIVHNRLDRSLLIFGSGDAEGSSSGRALGALQSVANAGGGEKLVWASLPGRPNADQNAKPPGPTEIPNETLRNFVLGLLEGSQADPGLFGKLRSILEQHEATADRAQDQGLLSVLTGRPLALVRASVKIELEGPPVADHSAPPTDKTNAPQQNADQPAQETWAAPLRFPLRVGDRRIGPDGFVGCFIEDGSPSAYQTLYRPSEQGVETSIDDNSYLRPLALEVSCDSATKPTMLTLLLDPKRGVNLVSGILPATIVTLPPALVADAVSNLQMPFLVAPVLGERRSETAATTGRNMPLPTNGHDEWRWLVFAEQGQPAIETPIQNDTATAPSLSGIMALHEGWLTYWPTKGGKA